MPDIPRLLTKPSELRALADRITAAGRLALDTEFVWERTYRPVLGVVQVATDDEVVVIDARALRHLDPLFGPLRDPAVPVILHGGGQDLEIFAELLGDPVGGVVDTQVEAAFLGYGLQVGLGSLLERVLKVRIRKDQTYTDWTRRPLEPEQLVYAREDVLHLLPLHDRMRADLDARDRSAWVDEELRRLEEPERYRPVPDEDRFWSVKGAQRLRPRELAILRATAAWREQAARRANVRPNFIVGDVVLVALAQRPVTDAKRLRGVRGLSTGTVERHGAGLVAAIGEGLACPDDAWPRLPRRSRRQPIPAGLGALLRAAVQTVAEREAVAPEVIVSSKEIDGLIGASVDGEDQLDGFRVLEGWRRTLVGETLIRLARGELAIRYDTGDRTVVVDQVRRPSRR